MEKEKKIFKIVQIVDQSTFVINGGSTQGIKEDDKFLIIGEKTNSIVDPDTSEVLEELPTYKAKIFADTVYTNVSICRTEWIAPSHSKGLAAGGVLAFQQAFAYDALKEHDVPGHYKELNIKEEESKPLLDHDDSPVKLGDKVKEL